MTFSTFASPGVSLQGGSGSGGGTPGGSTTQIQYNNAGAFAGASGLTTDGTNLTLGSASQLLWSTDLILTRRGAANLRLGAADAAAPVAQTLSVQSVVAGTSNTAGANLTITGSQGTGTGAGGSIVFQVAPAGSSGTAQNALADALTLNSARQIVSAIAGSASTPAYNFLSAGNGLYLSSNSLYFATSGGTVRFGFGTNGAELASTGVVGWSSSSTDASATKDLLLFRDDANKLALRNGTNAQVLRVYNTTDGTNSEWGALDWVLNATSFSVGTFKSGSGATRALQFVVGGTNIATFAASGHLLWNTDNLYDIGAAGATRPRNVYVANAVTAVGLISTNGDFRAGSANYFYWNSRSQMSSPADGNILLQNIAATDFGRLQFGGTTSSFPALKRSSTTLQARLADDSAFASVQGKLTTDTAYAAGDPTTTGYLVVYDSTGTAYKIPAVAV